MVESKKDKQVLYTTSMDQMARNTAAVRLVSLKGDNRSVCRLQLHVVQVFVYSQSSFLTFETADDTAMLGYQVHLALKLSVMLRNCP